MEEAKKIKALCAKYGIRPTKKFGQNFLVDTRIARMMVEAANVTPDDLVVEIGPGFGALTVELVKCAKRVVAVEIDKKLVSALEDIVYAEVGPPIRRRYDLTILCADILEISNHALACGDPKNDDRQFLGRLPSAYKVVASLPYSITSAALRKFTEELPRPSLIVLLVQKEVAERVCAKPGEMSVLSAAVQYYGKPEIVARVPRSCFWPQPKVDSAILKIVIYRGRTSDPTEVRPHDTDFEKLFFQVVRTGFAGKRKQLQNNLLNGLHISKERAVEALLQLGLNPKIRAQDLKVEDWIALARII